MDNTKKLIIGGVVVVMVVLVAAVGIFWFVMQSQNGQSGSSTPAVTDGSTTPTTPPLNEESKATIVSVYSSLKDTILNARNAHEIKPDNFGDFVTSKLATAKTCPKDAVEEGCWNKASQGDPGSEVGQPGVILTNGATLAGLDNGVEVSPGVWCNGIWVDWNGDKAPNIYGQDQFNIVISYGDKDGADWCAGVPAGQILIKPDEIKNQLQ